MSGPLPPPGFLERAYRLPAAQLDAGPRPVVDGLRELGWRPRTLSIGCAGPGVPDFDTTGPQPTIDADALIELRLLQSSGAVTVRRFDLARFRRVELDVSLYLDLSVWVYRAPTDTAIAVNVSNRDPGNLPPQSAWYAERYAVAGDYAVPPGAQECTPAVADPAFAWRALPVAGAGVSIATPAAVGVTLPVLAGRFRTTVPAWSAIWRILL